MTVNSISKEELLSLFETLSTRVEMLPRQQKAFVKLFLSNGKYSSIAKVAQLSVATIARRLKRIANRMSSDNFIAALLQDDGMPAEKMKIIRDYFVNGLSINAIAKNAGLSRYEVRKIIRQGKYL
jgi:DNA invertase Pin-like site-specific DNA recombinase